jgi:LDH2 family malate/lactate/ureidoglycolate dehydrogenase
MTSMANHVNRTIYAADRLHRFAKACMLAAGALEEDATITADVLVAADLRGKDAHGVARLTRYAEGVRDGKINGRPKPRVIQESAATVFIDADNGLGQPAAVRAMDLAIKKAGEAGIAAVGLRNTNHFGIAGYYAARARERGMIGFATSNATPQVAPTHGSLPMYGTNPIGIGLPTPDSVPFVLDMATSIAPRGKLERMVWNGIRMPAGWAVDPDGEETTDIEEVIAGLKGRKGHALLPLGGAGETLGGHKGYGLGLLVDLLAGGLMGSQWGRHVPGAEAAGLGQLLVALNVESFSSQETFEKNSEKLIEEIRSSPKAKGQDRILIPGERAAALAAEHEKNGIPITDPVREKLERLSKSFDVEL